MPRMIRELYIHNNENFGGEQEMRNSFAKKTSGGYGAFNMNNHRREIGGLG